MITERKNRDAWFAREDRLERKLLTNGMFGRMSFPGVVIRILGLLSG